MNKIICIISLVVCSLYQDLSAQTPTEAFRLSQSDPFGTARNLGVGNSMFAVGPDFSAIALNPSGLGGYKRSEFLITGGLSFDNNHSYLVSDSFNSTDANHSLLTLPNIGFVIHMDPVGTRWNSSNWAIGFHRVADYNRELEYSGRSLGSMTDSWRENALGVDPDDLSMFEEDLAEKTGAIYDFEEDNIWESDYLLNSQYSLFKSESNISEGGKSEIFLAYGAEYDEKLMVGFSFALPLLNYTESRNYVEEDEEGDGVPFFNELEYTSYLNTTGYGWNTKLAATFKPVQNINIALALHSPTWLRLTDDFNTTLTYDYTDGNHDGPLHAESPFGSFQYALRTPWSVSGGVSLIAGKSGFLAAHARYTDFSTMKYNYSVGGNGNQYEQLEREVNREIKQIYGSSLQLNVGGELVVTNYRIRGGLSFQQSAFNNDSTFDPSYHIGAGYRGENVYFDLGYKITKADEGYLPYSVSEAVQPLVISEHTRHHFAATVGFKF